MKPQNTVHRCSIMYRDWKLLLSDVADSVMFDEEKVQLSKVHAEPPHAGDMS